MSSGTPLIYGRRTVQKDGQTLDIILQQITPSLYEPVIDHMTLYYAAREPMCLYLDILSEPDSVEDFQNIWREKLRKGAGIVALVENDPFAPSHNIIGANITGICQKEKNSSVKLKGKKYIKIFETADNFMKEGDVFKKYGVDKYLTAEGLSVHPNYHGIGIGLHLLQARKQICQAFDLKMTATFFTAKASQHLARKVGFHTILEREFKAYEVNGEVYFPSLEEKMIIMVKIFD